MDAKKTLTCKYRINQRRDRLDVPWEIVICRDRFVQIIHVKCVVPVQRQGEPRLEAIRNSGRIHTQQIVQDVSRSVSRARQRDIEDVRQR